MVVDWVIRKLTTGQGTGIPWTLTTQLEDLDYADDIFLHKQKDAQEKLNSDAEETEKTGLKINIRKTEVIRANHKQQTPIQPLHQESIKEVDKFVYLGWRSRWRQEKPHQQSQTPPFALYAVWRSSELSQYNKISIFISNVKSVLIYGSETWRTSKTNSYKL